MKKRKLNGKFLSFICLIILIIISIFKIPNYLTYRNLKELGYNDIQIETIKEKKLDKLFIKNKYYSNLLKEEITKDTFDIKYLELYLNRDSLSNDEIYLYEKLKNNKGYTDEELIKLYSSLDYISLRPLIVFDKIEDLDYYIEDCLNHKENTLDSYKFSGNYLKVYQNTIEVNNKSDIEVLVNFKRSLGSYVPSKLVTFPISNYNSISGIYLESKCLDAFDDMANDLRNKGYRIYAIKGYVSYDDQASLYDWYDTDKEAYIAGTLKPGYNEAQTGLQVRIKATETDKTGVIFEETETYKYLSEHIHEYGFIFRYPANKIDFTGYTYKPDYIRYVGVDLATKIYESNMTFEEYYYLYME